MIGVGEGTPPCVGIRAELEDGRRAEHVVDLIVDAVSDASLRPRFAYKALTVARLAQFGVDVAENKGEVAPGELVVCRGEVGVEAVGFLDAAAHVWGVCVDDVHASAPEPLLEDTDAVGDSPRAGDVAAQVRRHHKADTVVGVSAFQGDQRIVADGLRSFGAYLRLLEGSNVDAVCREVCRKRVELLAL
ncbi:unnamed protein product [Phytophthora fragariaefolia]|uniref:Unnamed protein product n=1 Tax=Phytophthora fragariaefolia TaxID=1490495 RepID=A0A9W6Y457_9STRA|nr:unnamed protein product [Phytophthora fragariaefolia]